MASNSPVRNLRNQLFDSVYCNMMVDLIENSDSDDEEDILEDGVTCLQQIQNTRYLVERMKVTKNFSLFLDLLPAYDDTRFRRTLRMGREQFYRIVSLLQTHQTFVNNYYPVAVQLAIVLNRFGTHGNAASVMAIARNFGVGDGGTINTFTKRVIVALLAVEKKFIVWPSTTERRELSRFMTQKFLPNCIGFVDGTHIGLNNAPVDDALSYFNRKGFYSLNVQIICNPLKRIIFYHVGQPGKVHDSKVYSLMDVAQNPTHYFSQEQYVIGDAAYKLTKTTITPFRKTSQFTSRQEKFNNHISKQRIAIEHVNGILKSRFASLRGLRMVVNRENGHQFACEWTVACLILYNILLIDDPWTDSDFENDVTNDDVTADQDDINFEEEFSGHARREEMVEFILASLTK